VLVALKRFVLVLDASGPVNVSMCCDHNRIDCMGTVWFYWFESVTVGSGTRVPACAEEHVAADHPFEPH